MFLIKKKHFWLVVEPTHLKNMIVKMGSSSPKFGVKIKTYLKNHHLEFNSPEFCWWNTYIKQQRQVGVKILDPHY